MNFNQSFKLKDKEFDLSIRIHNKIYKLLKISLFPVILISNMRTAVIIAALICIVIAVSKYQKNNEEALI
jgi:hypothetical protein